mmetsp:Transcript_23489/g.52409  ORF Transcript_23489/g.52409 Transcript_23489/m.52409 type:complete len:667 (-) Transcript_23489:79-2079(-)
MPPFSQSENKMSTNYWGISNDDCNHSIGSDTFRREQRKTYDNRVEETEDVFNQHQVQSIFDNRHHAMTFEEDLNSVGESLVGYEHEDEVEDNESFRTKEEVKLSLIKRRQRLRKLEGAIDDNGSIDFSLKLKNNDDSSFISTMRDSLLSVQDSIQGSLLSKKNRKKSKDKDKKKKKSKSKEKERKDRKKKSKSKSKEKEREREKERKRKKKSRRDSSSDSSSESESEDDESDKYDKRRRNKSKDDRYDRDGERRRRHGEGRMDKSERSIRRKHEERLRRSARSEQYSEDEDSRSRDSPPKVRTEVDKRTGRCVYHPDVQLRRKRRDGSWKTMLSSCPECVEEAKRKEEKKRRIDKSARSAKSGGDKRRKDKSRGSRRRKSDSDSESSSSDSDDSRAKRIASRSNGRHKRDTDRANPKLRSRDGRGDDDMSYRTKSVVPDKPSRRTAAENGARPPRQDPRKSRSYHGDVIPRSKNERHHKSMNNVDSVDLKNASELMARVKVAAKSRRVTQHDGNLRDIERELMSQVSQISIGSAVEEFDADMKDPKYRLLKKVVRSYVTKNMQQGVSSGADPGAQQEASAHGYNIGDEGRRRDMIKDDNKDTALMRIASLESGDGAFIRRTEGNWTFAKVKSVEKDAFLFIVHANGSTKAYKTKYWVTHVRTLRTD